MTKKIILLLTTILCFLMAPLNTINANSDKLHVVATNSIIADITKNIAGDKIDLHSIVPIGQDPHEYEPLPEDIKKTTDADLILYNGINLEDHEDAWFIKLMKNEHKEINKDYFAVSKGVEVIYLENENEAGKEDPHAWLNIDNGILYAQNICQYLSEKDPENKSFYEANLKEYSSKLANLDKKAKKVFNEIEEDKKMIVTSEGCFKYFSKAYDIPSAYIWEINTEVEGTPEQIKALVKKIKDSNVSSIFVESSVNRRPMETVSNETGRPIYDVVFTDSIAEAGEEGDSYYAMMEHNLKVISEGLSK